MNVKLVLKKYFIPHAENEFKPHFFRKSSVVFCLNLIVLLFVLITVQSLIMTRIDFMAAILSPVLVDLANSDRKSNEIGSLRVSAALETAARRKAEDMAQKGYFAHVSPGGITPWFWLKDAGYKFTHAGENLAIHFSDSEDVEKAWMNSPSHRANLLNKNFTEIGVAAVKGTYLGRETVFVVQMFGRPSAVQWGNIPLKIDSLQLAGDQQPKAVQDVVLGETYEVSGGGTIKIIENDHMFIGFENSEVPDIQTMVKVMAETEQSKIFERLAASPRQILRYFYSSLGLLVIIALMLMIFIEIKRQHPRHIAYGLCLIILMAALFYLHIVIFGEASVI